MKHLTTTSVLLAAVLYSGVLRHFVGHSTAVTVVGVAGLTAVLVCWRVRDVAGVVFGGFVLISAVWVFAGIWPRSWPLVPVVPLALTLAAVRLSGHGLEVVGLRWGRTDHSVLVLVLPVIVLSGGGLVLWQVLAQPDLADFRRMIPDLGLFGTIAAALTFSILNALVEESIFRGLLQTALSNVFAGLWLPVVIQALVFGHAHFTGFPSGWSGVVLSASYGLVLGLIRVRSGGLGAPIVAHVFADLTIVGILVQLS